MNVTENKLNLIRQKLQNQEKVKIMIIGLGSVGGYVLDYLLSSGRDDIEITVVGRNFEKMQSDVNIVRVANSIRRLSRCDVKIVGGIDFNDVDSLVSVIGEENPDIILNSSRAYSGLKYGSISWKNVRAYGIWTPLSIKYVKNISAAMEKTCSQAIFINTSYSDAVIPWLKSAKKVYPDFGSGNVNHLVPRIKFAVADMMKVKDFWNIDVTYATAHFHDVVISKEGHTEGVDQLLDIKYGGKTVNIDKGEIFKRCSIAMPVDAKRNMMNASSNFDIISCILNVCSKKEKIKLHCPGAFGEIGGYPIMLDGTQSEVVANIDESVFDIAKMREANRKSIYLDGIENVENGILYYTDELIDKAYKAFSAKLPKSVKFDEIDEVAAFIISEIIEKYRG